MPLTAAEAAALAASLPVAMFGGAPPDAGYRTPDGAILLWWHAASGRWVSVEVRDPAGPPAGRGEGEA